jgi:hypothetical protein
MLITRKQEIDWVHLLRFDGRKGRRLLIMTLRTCLASIALALFLLCTNSSGYEVTKVIAVDSADSRPAKEAARWSPDGTQLAYFKQGRLMLSDTLGNVRQVTTERFGVHLYEWLSNSEIVLTDRQFPGDRSSIFKVVHINLESGQATVLDECVLGFGPKRTSWSLNGPYRSVQGNAYYIREENKIEIPKFIVSSAGRSPETTSAFAEDHILRWGGDGLYQVAADAKDSTLIFQKPDKGFPGGTLNEKRDYLVNGGTLLRLKDSRVIVLDTMIGERPVGTDGCGIIFEVFNPVFCELVFEISCDNGLDYVFDRVGTYNYETGLFTIIDPLAKLTECSSPACCPDGKKIAFLSRGRVYIVYREGL